MKSIININTSFKIALGVLSFAFFTSCVVPDVTEQFPPALSATCFDNSLNQGEYFVDCGGPCAPCGVGDPYVSVTIDSTWFEDSVKTSFRVFTPKDISINLTIDTGFVWVTANGAYPPPNDLQMHQLQFRIPKYLGRGVHEFPVADPGEYYESNPLGGNYIGERVNIEGGVITITNIDQINGWVSGEFEYILAPGTGNVRTVLIEGEFRDIPLK